MAIYQPTNITPDLISGEANGVVFIAAGTNITVSWQVNGNSQLVAYQIDFFKNDADSTAAGSTGKITLGTPFSAVSADGTQTRFSCQVAYSYFGFAAAFAATNYTGKFRITQWWGATDDYSVVQRSLSVYRINRRSSVSISTTDNGDGTFDASATFTAPNPDYGNTVLNWTRWRAYSYLSDGSELTVYDTGKVWGATSYAWNPGIFSPGNYVIEFTAESSQGETFKETASISSLPNAVIIENFFIASCDKQTGAVKTELFQNSFFREDAEIDGTYNVQDGKLVLGSNTTAVWSGSPVIAGNPWSVVWEGTLDNIPIHGGTVPIFEVLMSNGAKAGLHADTDNGLYIGFPGDVDLEVQIGGSGVFRFGITMGDTPETKNKFYFHIGFTFSGTYHYSGKWEISGFSQADISTVTIYGPSETVKWFAMYGNENSALVTYLTTGVDTFLQYGPSLWYNAGNVNQAATLDLGVASEFTVFRESSDGLTQKTIDAAYGEIGVIDVYDYGSVNGKEYSYMAVSPLSALAGSNASPILLKSNTVSPCFWEWTLIEAEYAGYENNNDGGYNAVNVFRFRGNVASGGIGNGAAPSVHSTFTRYPAVLRDTQNRKSGTLSGLIGWVNAPGAWTDSNDVRDAICNLSSTKNALFLRNRRGDFIKVAISGEITMTMNDNTLEQEITASVPWVEIGPVDGSVVSYTVPEL